MVLKRHRLQGQRKVRFVRHAVGGAAEALGLIEQVAAAERIQHCRQLLPWLVPTQLRLDAVRDLRLTLRFDQQAAGPAE